MIFYICKVNLTIQKYFMGKVTIYVYEFMKNFLKICIGK